MALVVKNLPANARDARDWFNPWIGTIPWKKEWQLTLAWEIPWTEEPVGYSLGGRKELDTTERLSTHTSHLEVGIPSWIFLKSSLNASPFHPGPFWGLQGFPEPWEFVSLKWRWWPPPALVQALPLTCAHLGTSLWAKRPGKQTQDFRLTATHSPATSHS